MDWNPAKYARFSGLRLRPAVDLLAQVGTLPDGPVCDLGCGAGAVGPVLRERFAGRHLLGLDSSAAMLGKAAEIGAYDALQQADIADWHPEQRFALIYSNAALHWLPDHPGLLPRLAGMLTPGGMLAVQVPHQNDAPSHRAWQSVAARLFPGRIAEDGGPGVLAAPAYFDLLSPLGQVSVWETEYMQRLDPVAQGHPVRHFTESTFARPILNVLNAAEQAELIAAYEVEMTRAYPLRPDGSALFPFRRLFFTLSV
ncbi:trans-aconitate 2-methyltransferase [Thalassovita litoralis]|jgi:trans-aconitate 2-methyltransferase|uniref:Trans-aconitate 2-methyltransferase n=1 Tax=Thalassovita litoralis TaxID=1010611 RepID=A0A521EYT3_9RHOB|nr:methyltransferase domain-containing protein [Thalassovita litoralis]SMO89055.1 trans-aconitate 2-methyltransferase [Thalassovita litoralis]